jgi:hypothetical protein
MSKQGGLYITVERISTIVINTGSGGRQIKHNFLKDRKKSGKRQGKKQSQWPKKHCKNKNKKVYTREKFMMFKKAVFGFKKGAGHC